MCSLSTCNFLKLPKLGINAVTKGQKQSDIRTNKSYAKSCQTFKNSSS